MAEFAEQLDVHHNQIQIGNKNLLCGAGEIFEDGNARGKDPEAEIRRPHPRIGQLSMERDFLSEKLGRLAVRRGRR